MKYHKVRVYSSKPAPFYRKVGGLHFLRFWRFRMSFCLVRPTINHVVYTEEQCNGRAVTHERYLAG